MIIDHFHIGLLLQPLGREIKNFLREYEKLFTLSYLEIAGSLETVSFGYSVINREGEIWELELQIAPYGKADFISFPHNAFTFTPVSRSMWIKTFLFLLESKKWTPYYPSDQEDKRKELYKRKEEFIEWWRKAPYY